MVVPNTTMKDLKIGRPLSTIKKLNVMQDYDYSKFVVLYADDDRDDLDLVTQAFSDFATNIQVVTVSNGLEAVTYLNNLESTEASPCLIILDINMPLLNGKEALKEIRKNKKFADIPIILFSTSSLPFDKVFAERHQAGFVTKPITEPELNQIVSQFLSHCSESIKMNIQTKC